MIYLDVSETVSTELNTGIQRVVRELTRELLQINEGIKLVYFNGHGHFNECQLEDIALRPRKKSNYQIIKNIFKKLVPNFLFVFARAIFRFFFYGWQRLLLAFVKPKPRVKEIAGEVGLPISFGPEDTFIILDTVWHCGALYSNALKKVKESGARTVLVSYDLIPITHPQFCDNGLTHHFKSFYFGVIPQVDEFIAISKYSMDTLKNYIQKDLKLNLNNYKFNYFYLGHTPMTASQGVVRDEVKNLKEDGNYILAVSTVEPRKNYGTLLKAFLAANIPKGTKLVIVGRDGWKNDEVKRLIKSPRQIRWFSDCADFELKELYEGCILTVFPSFVEGYGLPVLESLSQKKYVLSSNEGALPEAGGEFVDYFSPYESDELKLLLEKYLNNQNLLDEKNRKINTDFTSRSWKQSAEEFLSKLELDYQSNQV